MSNNSRTNRRILSDLLFINALIKSSGKHVIMNIVFQDKACLDRKWSVEILR